MDIIFVEHCEAAEDGVQKNTSSSALKQLLGELWLQSHKSCEKLLSVAKP